ncbi:hypothetical protein ABGB09_02730 [Streptomyces sp. B8F3]|uniref:hypothetical protein n=1 Tax=Streptomyces sp. B8F3 TaxID=3153573 RepID=UPI00325EEB4C
MSTEHTPGPAPEPEPAHARASGPDGRDADDPGGLGRHGEPGHPDGGRRRPGVLVAAAVAAAVMLTGGGVAYLVDRTDDGGGAGSDGGEPPPLRLDGLSVETAATGARGPLRLVGELPEGPDEAPVFEPAGRVGAADVARLAEALGMDGRPREEGGGWRVGVSRDGQGPLLQVQAEAPGAWTYHQYGGTACDLPLPAQQDGGDPDAAVTSACEAPAPRPGGQAGDPVPGSAAEKAAEPVLAAVGQKDAEVAAAEPFGAVRTVTAEPVVGGLPTTGWQTSLQIGGDGQVTGGNGYLAAPAEADTYPVITADAAFRELNEPSGGNGEEPAVAPACASAVPYEKGTGPGKPPAGKVDPCMGRMTPTKVRGAEFGLSAQSVEGRPVLVPSWLFAVTSDAPTPFHGGKPGTIVWPQLAVAPEYVTSAEPSTPPVPEPAPPTSAPGAEPGAGGGSGSDSGSAPGTGSGSAPESPGQVEPAEPAQPPSSAPAEQPENGGAVGSAVGIESYSVSGRTLELHFWGGVCTDYAATADESDGTVTVRLTGEEKPGQVCIKIAKRLTETVELSAPLDGRRVVDARTGERVAAKEE